MTPTPVGMRCPECMQQRTRVVRNPVGTPGQLGAFPATIALIALNVVVYLIEILQGSGGLNDPGRSFVDHYSLVGFFVAEGQWYRLLTSGFIHLSFTHILFNMIVLFFLGRLVEPAIGTARFVSLYFASLLAGSVGALVFSGSLVLTAGASGAIFGVAGAGLVIALGRGAEQVARTIGILLAFNFFFDLADTEVSLGGHIGGLVGGGLCAAVIVAGDRGMLGPRRVPAEIAAMVLVGAISVVAAIAIA
jgi:membrane associated rhomboid family serine protease